MISRVARYSHYLLAAGLAAGLAIYLLSFALHAWMVLHHPYPLDYGEGPLLTQAELVRQGTPVWELYRDPARPPYTIVNYPPLYPLLAAIGGWVSGNTLLAGRLLSLGATFGCLIAIVLLSNQRTGQSSVVSHSSIPPSPTRAERWPHIAAAVVFLTIPIIREWSVFMRVDMLGVCLGLWGLVALQRRQPVLAALLLLLSLYTKPSLLAAPVAAVVWVVIGAVSPLFQRGSATRDKSRLPQAQAWPVLRNLLLVLIGGSGLLFGVLQWSSNGWFALHVVTANANRWDGSLARHFWLEQAQLRWPLALAAAASIAWGMVAFNRQSASSVPGDGDSNRYPWRLPTLYTLVAILVAIGVGKVGAYANYFLEYYAGLVWLVVLAISPSLSLLSVPATTASDGFGFPERLRWRGVSHRAIIPVLLLLLLASLAYYPPMWSKTTLYRAGIIAPNPPRLAFGRYALWDDLRREQQVLAALERVHTALKQDVRAAGDDIVTDVPGVAAEAGVFSRVQLFEHRQLLDQGVWDQHSLLQDLANGQVPLAVIDYLGNWMSPQMVDVLVHRYAHDESVGMFKLYRPVNPGPRHSTDIAFGNTLHLSGYHLQAASMQGQTSAVVVAGDVLIVTLEWQRTSPAPQGRPTASDTASEFSRPLQVTVSLTDERGQPILQSTRPILYGVLAVEAWPEGVPIQHMQPLALPPDLPPRFYRLAVTVQANGKPVAPSATLTTISTTTTAAAGGRLFEQTGFFVPHPVLRAWQRLGGVERAGDPLTPLVPFGWGRLQCFEYVCLEWHGDAIEQRAVGQQIYLAETRRSTGCSGPQPLQQPVPGLCPSFVPFWERYGPALGAVVSGAIERNGWMVQWTRYARLERLPGSTPPAMGLGRLGEESLYLGPGVRYAWPGE